MPKLSQDFPAQLSLQVTQDMRIQLIAIGYYLGNGGEYASAARNLLRDAINQFVENIPERRKKEFHEILANVTVRETKKPPG
jgi:hypothetical protein